MRGRAGGGRGKCEKKKRVWQWWETMKMTLALRRESQHQCKRNTKEK